MKHLFLSHKLAAIAKEKGFMEECFGCYVYGRENQGVIFAPIKNVKNDHSYTAAPIYQQMIDWFREKHSIRIHEVNSAKIWYWCISTKDYPLMHFCHSIDKAMEEAFKLI